VRKKHIIIFIVIPLVIAFIITALFFIFGIFLDKNSESRLGEKISNVPAETLDQFYNEGIIDIHKGSPYTNKELTEHLKRHLKILKNNIDLFYKTNDTDLIPEMAIKLRALVCSTRNNRPLLIDLMKDYDSKLLITLGGKVRGKEKVTVEEYIKDEAAVIRIKDKLVSITKADLIKIFADKEGAHQDRFKDIRIERNLIYINGVPINKKAIFGIAETIYDVGNKFLKEIEQRK
jgi:hypothetical protein